MRSTGRVDKLNRGRRGMRSVTISVVAVSCVSLLVFGSNKASAQNRASCVRRPSSRASRIRKRARARFSPRPQR